MDESTEENNNASNDKKPNTGTVQLNAAQILNGTSDPPVKKLQHSEVEETAKPSPKEENPANDQTQTAQFKKSKKKKNAGKCSSLAKENNEKATSKGASSETISDLMEVNNDRGTTVSPPEKRKKKLKKCAGEIVRTEKSSHTPETEAAPGKKRKKKNKAKRSESTSDQSSKTKKRKLNDSEARQGGKRTKSSKPPLESSISDARLAAFGINAKKYRNKLKYGPKPSS